LLEPVRAGGQPSARRGAGRDLPSLHVAGNLPAGPVVMDVLLRVHDLSRAPLRLPPFPRFPSAPAAGARRGGRMGLLDLRSLLLRLERRSVGRRLSAPSPGASEAGLRRV